MTPLAGPAYVAAVLTRYLDLPDMATMGVVSSLLPDTGDPATLDQTAQIIVDRTRLRRWQRARHG